MIDIIIPAYNAHKTLGRCLASILSQSFEDYQVTVVTDGGEFHTNVIEKFKPLMKIREIYNQDRLNRGAGYARQFGLDHTNGEFVMFMDADDVLYTPYALHSLYNGIMIKPIFSVCVGQFIEEVNGSTDFILHQNDMVWMFGKLYKREFLKQFNIRFCPGSRWEEDHGFNTCVKLNVNDYAQINFITDIVYSWRKNENSITSDDTYRFGKCFVGNVENMMWAISNARQNPVSETQISQFAVETLLSLYQYLLELYANDKRFLRQAWEWLQMYYDDAIRPIEDQLTDEVIAMFYSYIMKNAYGNGELNNIIPFITIHDFIKRLREKEEIDYIEDDMSDYFPSDSAWM